jgi:hypothetical protein
MWTLAIAISGFPTSLTSWFPAEDPAWTQLGILLGSAVAFSWFRRRHRRQQMLP